MMTMIKNNNKKTTKDNSNNNNNNNDDDDGVQDDRELFQLPVNRWTVVAIPPRGHIFFVFIIIIVVRPCCCLLKVHGVFLRLLFMFFFLVSVDLARGSTCYLYT